MLVNMFLRRRTVDAILTEARQYIKTEDGKRIKYDVLIEDAILTEDGYEMAAEDNTVLSYD